MLILLYILVRSVGVCGLQVASVERVDFSDEIFEDEHFVAGHVVETFSKARAATLFKTLEVKKFTYTVDLKYTPVRRVFNTKLNFKTLFGS